MTRYATDHEHDNSNLGCALLVLWALVIFWVITLDRKITTLEHRVAAVEEAAK